ncbi:MAG: N-acetyltransferase [Clostridia bacterium]|nr:MAG: N-acetyltransferase [Clostridia bacterium]
MLKEGGPMAKGRKFPEGVVIEKGARVYPGAKLGAGVKVGAFSQVFPRTVVGEGCVIEPYCLVGLPVPGRRENTVIGKGSLIRSGSVIYAGVVAGPNLRTGHHCVIREGTRLGENVLVGSHVVIDGCAFIGARVSLQTGAYVTRNTVIEDEVFFGPYAATTNDRYMRPGAELKGPRIGASARVGSQAVILPGITVGEGSVIGAGALVNRDTGPGETVAGVPARALIKQ